MAGTCGVKAEMVLETSEAKLPRADDGLRKAAVFLKHLDPQTADCLLKQLPPQRADQVRAALAALESVDRDEADSVAEEFLRGERRAPLRPHVPEDLEDAVEINPSLVERLARGGDEGPLEDEPAEPAVDAPGADAGGGFAAFLHQFTIEDLARFCNREHPQTTSVILAHLSAERAAETLRQVPPRLHGTILHRVAHLDTVAPAVLQDLRQQLLESRPADPDRTPPRAPPRQSSVEAILQVLEARQRQSLIESLGRGDPQMAACLGLPGRPETEPQSGGPPPPDAEGCEAEPEDEAPASLQFEELATVDDGTLSKLIQYADARILLLALSGASPQLVNRLLVGLPPRDARSLRRQITELAPTRLRDIELAQAQLVALAIRLDHEGTIRLPHLRRFVSAA